MIDQILPILAEMGGAAGIAYLLFRYLGKSWIESRFSERLEHFKHQQVIEIQRLRVEIDSRLSGVLKIQEKEFETLPEAWSKLDEAYMQVTALVLPFQEYPNLDGMSSARLNEFLDKSVLLGTQKDEIRQSRAKSQRYVEMIFWPQLHQVRMACYDLDRYVVRYGIFFPPNLKEKFNKIINELNSAVQDKAKGQEEKDFTLQNEGWKKIKDKIAPLFQEIETEIHARLQSHGSSQ